VFGIDAIILAALAGRDTARIELGTAVVPTYTRHPVTMAQQALSAQAATRGRFALGSACRTRWSSRACWACRSRARLPT